MERIKASGVDSEPLVIIGKRHVKINKEKNNKIQCANLLTQTADVSRDYFGVNSSS